MIDERRGTRNEGRETKDEKRRTRDRRGSRTDSASRVSKADSVGRASGGQDEQGRRCRQASREEEEEKKRKEKQKEKKWTSALPH